MESRTSLGSLLKRAYNLYQDNFISFFQLAAAQVLISLISSATEMIFPGSVLQLLISIGLLYFQFRLLAALIYMIDDALNRRMEDPLFYYHKSGEKIWIYIGVTFLLGLILIVPALLIFGGILLVDETLFTIIMVVIGVTAGVILLSHFYLAPYIVLFDESSTKALNESSRITKPYRATTILIIMIIAGLNYLPYLAFQGSGIGGIIETLISAIVVAIISPLTTSLVVIFYREISNPTIDVID